MRDLKLPDQRHPEKAHRPVQTQPKKPDWIRVKAPGGAGYAATHKIMREHKLTTVCEEAGCPNVGECWSQGHATMMIMGEICTRGCTFCNVATGRPDTLDAFEPGRVAHAVEKLGALSMSLSPALTATIWTDGGPVSISPRPFAPCAIAALTQPSKFLTPRFPENARLRRWRSLSKARPDLFNHKPGNRARTITLTSARRRAISTACAVAAGEGTGPDDVHQIGDHGGLGEERQGVLQVMDDMRSADVEFHDQSANICNPRHAITGLTVS